MQIARDGHTGPRSRRYTKLWFVSRCKLQDTADSWTVDRWYGMDVAPQDGRRARAQRGLQPEVPRGDCGSWTAVVLGLCLQGTDRSRAPLPHRGRGGSECARGLTPGRFREAVQDGGTSAARTRANCSYAMNLHLTNLERRLHT